MSDNYETRRPLVRKWTDDEDELIRSMAADGKSVQLIAARLRRAAMGVRARARSLGVVFETQNDRRKRLGMTGAWRP